MRILLGLLSLVKVANLFPRPVFIKQDYLCKHQFLPKACSYTQGFICIDVYMRLAMTQQGRKIALTSVVIPLDERSPKSIRLRLLPAWLGNRSGIYVGRRIITRGFPFD